MAPRKVDISVFTQPAELPDELKQLHTHFQLGDIIWNNPAPPVQILRPEDLLCLTFTFENLKVADGSPPTLGRLDAAKNAYIMVDFGPQHLMEEAFLRWTPRENRAGVKPVPADPDDDISESDIATKMAPGQRPVGSRLAGNSRLVFKVSQEPVEFTSAGLLQVMSSFELSVTPNARAAKLLSFSAVDIVRENIGAVILHEIPGPEAPAQLSTIQHGRELLMATAAVLQHRFGGVDALAALESTNIGGRWKPRHPVPVDRLDLALPEPRMPQSNETALELPWRLILSPHDGAAFAHSHEAVEHDQWVELWHARLGLRVSTGDVAGIDERPSRQRTVRAVWTRDFNQPGQTPDMQTLKFPDASGNDDKPPIRSSLNMRDRMMLVHETSNFYLWDRTPPAIEVNRLMLTALGGWLETHFASSNFPKKANGLLTISEWKHRAAMGRDFDVKVVYAGFLLPFGHRASLVKVTQRVIHDGPGGTGDPTAYLFQKFFIVPQEPQKTFRNYTDGFPQKDSKSPSFKHRMPLSMVRILTPITPELEPIVDKREKISSGHLFVPYVGKKPFEFQLVALDVEGRILEFSGPLMFMEADHNLNSGDHSPLTTALDIYNNTKITVPEERAMKFNGQRVFYAPEAATDDTALATQTIFFNAETNATVAKRAPSQAGFLPVMREASVVVPAISSLAGQKTPATVKYPQRYASNGFTENRGEIFLQVDPAYKMGFHQQTQRSGGFAAPSIDVSGLSRISGPVGGDINMMADPTAEHFSMGDIFSATDAKLFGIIPLVGLVSAIGFDQEQLPKFVAQTLNASTVLIQNLERLGAGLGTAGDALPSSAALVTQIDAITGLLSQLPANPDSIKSQLEVLFNSFRTTLINLQKDIPSSLLPRPQKEQLAAVVARLTDQLADADGPMKTVDVLTKAAKGEVLPEVLTARMDWSTELSAWPAGAAIFQPKDPSGNSSATGRLTLAVEVQAATRPEKDSTAMVSCSLTPFALQLIGVDPYIALHFKTMEFSLTPGKKPDVNVELDGEGLVFSGALEFVNTLKEIIPLDGFSDPPYLDVSTSGIVAGFELAIPNIPLGIFALTNIAFGARFVVPFIGESIEVTFSFCSRENPFRLQVAMFAGGGFFAITITPKKLKTLEASLEFGAAVSLDFGVASGSISVMAGIYFKMMFQDSGDTVKLTGYFRARGEVDVLGLISACIEIYLELSYESGTHKAVGRASITVEVSVAFFSTSVSISCEKKFAGSAGDPTFAQVMSPYPEVGGIIVDPWADYCNAFSTD